ncbi:MAG: ABC transporter substrate-binding protein [Nocardioidaceae bacterium]
MRNRKRRTMALTASLIATAIITAACGSSDKGSSDNSDSDEPVKGGTLNLLGVGDVDYMDPNVTYYSLGYMAMRMVSRQLVTFPAVEGKTTTVAPDLAEEIPTTDNGGISADGKTYTIKLRAGVNWNTDPVRAVTAADFVRGVKRTCNPVQPFGAGLYFTSLIVGMDKFCSDFQAPYAAEDAKPATAADIKKYIENTDLPGVVAKDSSTIEIHLTHPASYFTDMLALTAFSPAPVEFLDYLPGSAELGKNLISDGPYQIDSYEPTKSLELSRNPAWDASTDPIRKAYVDKVSVNMTGDQANIQKQLETGNENADMAWDTFPLATDVPRLVAKKDSNLVITPSSSSNPYIVYNIASPNNDKALSKLEFRQALSNAINRDNIIQVLGGPTLNDPLTHVLPPTIVGSEDNDPYPYDVDKAKSLMQQAGVSSPTLKVLYRNESNGSTKTYETLQSDLGKVGIKVVGVPASNADFYTKWLQSPAKARSGDFDLAIAGWGSDWYGNAALSYFQPLFAGKPAFPPNGSNFGLYDSAKTNQLIEQAAQASDEESAAIWAEADKQVMADAAFYPLTSPKTANYHASQVHNAVGMDVYQNFDPTNVWLSKDKQG